MIESLSEEGKLSQFLRQMMDDRIYLHLGIHDLVKKQFFVKKILSEDEFSRSHQLFNEYFTPAKNSSRKRSYHDITLTIWDLCTPDETGFSPASSSHPLKRQKPSGLTEVEQKAVGNLTTYFQKLLLDHTFIC